jgi:hypothetical protein
METERDFRPRAVVAPARAGWVTARARVKRLGRGVGEPHMAAQVLLAMTLHLCTARSARAAACCWRTVGRRTRCAAGRGRSCKKVTLSSPAPRQNGTCCCHSTC